MTGITSDWRRIHDTYGARAKWIPQAECLWGGPNGRGVPRGGMKMRKDSLAAVLSLVALVAVFAAADARAGQTCTDGVDCYCDCGKGTNRGDGFVNAACATKGVAIDRSVLLCEDFEARTLTENIGVGAGAPFFGPWYDAPGSRSGSGMGRGSNSYWNQTYGPANQGCAWRQGQPANPKLGLTCGGSVCYADEWSQGNPWDANPNACIDIMRNGEFDDELPSNTEPTIPGGGAGVFDGRQIIAHRVPKGDGAGPDSASTGGFHGTTSFGHTVTNFGMTWAMAFPADVASSHVLDSQWKFNETAGPGSNNSYEGWPVGNYGIGWLTGGETLFPFAGYIRASDTAACESLDDNSRALVGQKQCNHGVGLYLGPNPTDYQQARDYPFGTWGCIQAYFYDMNTANAKTKIWFNGKLIVDIDGLDSSRMVNAGYSSFHWNHYANYNQFAGQATTKATYRYEDNMHIREGAPVSCQQIGFTSLTAPAPPPVGQDPTPPATTLGKPGTPVYRP